MKDDIDRPKHSHGVKCAPLDVEEMWPLTGSDVIANDPENRSIGVAPYNPEFPIQANTIKSSFNICSFIKDVASEFRESVGPVLLSNKMNWMLLFGPVALFFHSFYEGNNVSSLSFVLAALTLIPCAERLSYITEQIADQTNDTIGGLTNATFGNAPELLISASALDKGYFRLVQLALLGSMLTNLLLVFGASSFVGGLRWKVQSFDSRKSVNLNALLLMLSTVGVLLPAALEMSGEARADNIDPDDEIDENKNRAYGYEGNSTAEVEFSRRVAAILVFVYIGYMILTLCTENDEIDDAGRPVTFKSNDFAHVDAHNITFCENGPLYAWYCERFGVSGGRFHSITNFFDEPVNSQNDGSSTLNHGSANEQHSAKISFDCEPFVGTLPQSSEFVIAPQVNVDKTVRRRNGESQIPTKSTSPRNVRHKRKRDEKNSDCSPDDMPHLPPSPTQDAVTVDGK